MRTLTRGIALPETVDPTPAIRRMPADAFVAAFVARLGDHAGLLLRYGAAEAAATCAAVADELERAFAVWWNEELGVAEAAGESGYSEDRLRQLVRQGRIPDQRAPGSQGEIRVRRSDLPRRPPSRVRDPADALASSILLARK